MINLKREKINGETAEKSGCENEQGTYREKGKMNKKSERKREKEKT